MFFIVAAIILGLFILGGLAVAVLSETSDGKAGGFGTAVVAFVILIVVWLFMSITTVSARTVGIGTEFGKYDTTLSAGLHFTKPWLNVEEFSTQAQPLELTGDKDVKVTFKGGGTGFVGAVPRWRINPEDDGAAQRLWEKYRTFDRVRDYLVAPQFRDSFRFVLANYTPNEARAGDNLREVTDLTLADVDKNLADEGIVIDSVSLQYIQLDENTQRSLDQIVSANNNIERAKAEKQRAIIDAETAKIREQGGSLSPAALVRYCLEVTNAWDQGRNGNLPAGWNCFANPGGVLTLNK